MAGVDDYYVFVVGHDVQSRCDVANAMIKDKSKFKQFRSRRNLLVKSMKSATVAGHHLNIALTPTLNSPAWATLSNQIKVKYKNRIFVYVKDKGVVDADDISAIRKLKETFTDCCVLLVVDTEDTNQDTVKSMIEEVGDGFSCKFRSTASFGNKKAQANEILQQIKHLIETPKKKSVTKSEQLEVGAESNAPGESKQRSKDEEASTLVDTVNVPKEPRCSTSDNPLVKLEETDWILFQETLKNGKAKSNHVRVNVVGNQSVGKTTLVGRLQANDKPIDTSPTETLEINRITSRCVEVNSKREWDSSPTGYEHDLNLQRMAQALKGSELENIAANLERTNVKDSADIDEFDLDVGSEEFEEVKFGRMISVLSDRASEEKDEYVALQKKEHYLQEVIRKKNYSRGERMYVSYWDYAGQATYYSTHQAFLSPSAVYLLVVDLSQDLDLRFTDSLEFRTGVLKKSTVAESIQFWISSIKAYTSDKDGGHAPVLLVGTHKDKVKPERIEEMFKQIRKLIEMDIECVAIDNTLDLAKDENLEALRDRILDVGLGIVDEEVPAQWIDLESTLLERKFSGTAIMTFAEISALDNALDVPMNDPRRLEAFLEHQHCRGHLMYFHHQNKNDLIILDPMILATFLNELLRKTENQSPTKQQSGWNQDGTITEQYIQDVAFRMKENHDITENVHDLLSILVKLHILIIHPTRRDHYFLPCLLPDKPNVDEDEGDVKEMAPRVDVAFEDKNMPPAFYHLLVSAMHKKYSIVQLDEVPQIYNLYTCFCVGTSDTTWLELSWKASRLCIDVKNFSKKTQLKNCQCHEILDDIESMIDEVLRTYRHDNVNYKFRIECPKHKDPHYIVLQKLKEKEEAMCTKKHAVTLEEATGIYFSKEICEYNDDRLCKSPSDKDLGRLARHLDYEESALSLARLLRMSNCMTKADRAIQNSGRNNDLARLKILQIWRNMYPTSTVWTLCNKLKKSGDYDKDSLIRVVKDDGETGSDHGLPADVLDKVPNDRLIENFAGHIGKNYIFIILELGLQIVEVERLETDNPRDMKRVVSESLRKWRSKNPSTATIRHYLNVLGKFSTSTTCHLASVVDTIRHEFEL